MCGINGFIHLIQNAISETTLFNSFMKIKHRGPDFSAFHSFPEFAIGFHRLSINDLSFIGNQPFIHHHLITNNSARTIYLICNGEIYNSDALKEKYTPNGVASLTGGYKFTSTSDCEILLALFIENNGLIDFMHEVDGEFSIAVFDVTKNIITGKTKVELHLARDRFGIRPLFTSIYRDEENNVVSFGFGSEMKALFLDNAENIHNTVNVFPPRTVTKITINEGISDTTIRKFIFDNQHFYSLTNQVPRLKNEEPIKLEYNEDDFKTACAKIRSILLDTVTNYLHSDREIGCLLSGGLDSSLISAIASNVLKQKGKLIHTFSIGMPDSPDVINANIVAKHIGSIHTNIEVTEEAWLSAIDEIIKITETYDITTIRATIGQYLVSKWIKEHTNIKVLLVGDGSDELFGGYLYFHNAPTENDFQEETIRRLHDIHYFDVLRTDRGIASNGLEARVPFLNHHLVDYVLSVNPIFKMPTYNRDIEKYILRKAFENTNLLPDCILWRPKVAFSDGVSKKSKSTYVLIQEKLETTITDDELKNYVEECREMDVGVVPYTKESMHYHRVFSNEFRGNFGILKYYWLPKWCGNGVLDPSARTLAVCNEE